MWYVCSLCACRCFRVLHSLRIVGLETRENINAHQKNLERFCCDSHHQGNRFLIILRQYSNTSTSDEDPEAKKLQQTNMREKFWEKENDFESQVDYQALSESEKLIHKLHREAIERGHFTYDDPQTGYKVFTRLRHFLRGSCCGNACRHVSLSN